MKIKECSRSELVSKPPVFHGGQETRGSIMEKNQNPRSSTLAASYKSLASPLSHAVSEVNG